MLRKKIERNIAKSKGMHTEKIGGRKRERKIQMIIIKEHRGTTPPKIPRKEE